LNIDFYILVTRNKSDEIKITTFQDQVEAVETYAMQRQHLINEFGAENIQEGGSSSSHLRTRSNCGSYVLLERK